MRTIIFMIMLLCSGVANAQAFGVNMGDTVSKHGGVSIGDSLYRIKVPQPNSEFESYLALATPSTGICKVIGIGRDYKNDSYGTQIRSSYASLQQALNSKYGANKTFDFIRSGALWDKQNEFVWSIFKNERTMATFWTRNEGSTLPATMTGVSLQIKSTSASSIYIGLTYEFANSDECRGLIKNSQNSGL